LSKRLVRRLQRLVVYYRAGGSLDYVLAQARNILLNHFEQLIQYTFRSHVKRDLHRRKGLKELGFADIQALRSEVENKLEDFRKILLDVA